ncbi:hypothetical protein [Pseudomonas sp. B329]|uniref:hypothetical protein n=1 Tax=Pseudomonas sp. B329 TaxID=1553459 RepID=UPI0032B7B8BC|nr:hypothetical protein [Pseudomonas sp. B329]
MIRIDSIWLATEPMDMRVGKELAWHPTHLSSSDEILRGYTMLRVNAYDHEFMSNYPRPEDEKRMVVIIPRGLYHDWLAAAAETSNDFMR